MVALVKPPELSPPMTAETFYALNPGGAEPYQLVDGEPQAMSPASPDHGALQGELGRAIGNALRAAGSRCRLVVAPGVMPRPWMPPTTSASPTWPSPAPTRPSRAPG